MLRLVLLLSFFSVVSCATKSQTSKAPLESVGVVALFDDQLPLIIDIKSQKKSPQKETIFSTSQWDLNEAFVSEYDMQLKSLNRQAIHVSLNAQTVVDLKREARALKDIYLGNRWQILTQYVLGEAEKQGARHVILVHPASNSNYGSFKAGYGISCLNKSGKKSSPTAYFLMRAELWNVATRKVESISTVTPEQASESLDRNCEQLKGLKGERLTAETKSSFMGLVKKVTALNLEGLGLKNSLN